MSLSSAEVDSLLSVGYPLDHLGWRSWALSREQALEVLNRFEAHGVPVVGGDVLEIIEGRLQMNYDMWSCDPAIGEPVSEFAERSIAAARKYITNYRSVSGKVCFFVLVPDVERPDNTDV